MNLALIGTGSMAHAHARQFGALPDCRLYAAVDVDLDTAQAFADAYGIPHASTDTEAVLSDPAVDAVAVVTPDAFHKPISLAAFDAGKHVFCEKPLALTYPDAAEMAAAAERSGKVHAVNLTYRRSSALQRAAEMVRAGTLGTIRHFEARYLQSWATTTIWGDWRTEPLWLWRMSTAHGSVGVLGDIGVHILDFASFVVGSFDEVACRLKTFEKVPGNTIGEYTLDANDSAFVMASTVDGAEGVVHMSRHATGHANSLTLSVHGTEGALRLNLDTSYHLLETCLGDAALGPTWTPVLCTPTPTNQVRFIDAIRAGTPAEPDFHRGAEVQRVLDACLASNADGRRVRVDSVSA